MRLPVGTSSYGTLDTSCRAPVCRLTAEAAHLGEEDKPGDAAAELACDTEYVTRGRRQQARGAGTSTGICTARHPGTRILVRGRLRKRGGPALGSSAPRSRSRRPGNAASGDSGLIAGWDLSASRGTLARWRSNASRGTLAAGPDPASGSRASTRGTRLGHWDNKTSTAVLVDGADQAAFDTALASHRGDRSPGAVASPAQAAAVEPSPPIPVQKPVQVETPVEPVEDVTAPVTVEPEPPPASRR